jgi:hypothetical protein
MKRSEDIFCISLNQEFKFLSLFNSLIHSEVIVTEQFFDFKLLSRTSLDSSIVKYEGAHFNTMAFL